MRKRSTLHRFNSCLNISTSQPAVLLLYALLSGAGIFFIGSTLHRFNSGLSISASQPVVLFLYALLPRSRNITLHRNTG